MRKTSILLALGLMALATAWAAGVREKGPEPIHIARGQEVKLADYLVPGKTTVFDFYSEYCPDCKTLEPHLDKLHRERSDLAVVKVDINRPDVHGRIDWNSPVARQYRIRYTPQFVIYGPDGALLAKGESADKQVDEWIR